MLKVKNKVNLKCNKCRHYYRGASFGGGYNPIPCCHRLEDTGVRANPLTCECFEKTFTNETEPRFEKNI